MGANVPVQIPEGQTLTDNGTLNFAAGDMLTMGSACCSAAEIAVAGTLTAAGTTFTGIGDSGTIVVAFGGIIMPTGSTFDVPLFLPYNDVPSLAAGNNMSFDQIEISSGTLPSGNELNLNLIGTNPTNLNYIISGAFTVASGSTLAVGPNVSVQVSEGVTLTDNGTLSFAIGDTLTMGSSCCSAAEIIVAGIMTAAGTTFTGTSSSGSIVVNSGGSLNMVSSTYSLTGLTLNSGSTDTLKVDVFSGKLTVNSNANVGTLSVPTITGDDFSNVGANGIVASGDPNASIPFAGNYWGTTVTAQIAAKIDDHNVNANLPTIAYQPFVSGASGTSATPKAVTFSPDRPDHQPRRDGEHHSRRRDQRRDRDLHHPERHAGHRPDDALPQTCRTAPSRPFTPCPVIPRPVSTSSRPSTAAPPITCPRRTSCTS